MDKKNRTIVSIESDARESGCTGGVNLLKQILALRAWCRQNLKGAWRSYNLTSTSGFKHFIVFEFDSKKDEMFFKLYTGK